MFPQWKTSATTTATAATMTTKTLIRGSVAKVLSIDDNISAEKKNCRTIAAVSVETVPEIEPTLRSKGLLGEGAEFFLHVTSKEIESRWTAFQISSQLAAAK